MDIFYTYFILLLKKTIFVIMKFLKKSCSSAEYSIQSSVYFWSANNLDCLSIL